MITFASLCEAQYIEKKSKFLAAGLAAGQEADALKFLENRRKLHRGASHHVFAMRIGSAERYSDDGEPAGTAGLPVLNLLRQEGLQNAIVVVTRYFGGVLLGAGGLARAYGHSAKLLLEKQNLVQKVPCRKISLTVNYSLSGKIRHLLQCSDVLTLSIFYDTETTFLLLTRSEAVELFLKQVSDILSGGGKITLLDEIEHVYPFSQRV